MNSERMHDSAKQPFLQLAELYRTQSRRHDAIAILHRNLASSLATQQFE